VGGPKSGQRGAAGRVGWRLGLEGFLDHNVVRPPPWRPTAGLGAAGYSHEPHNLSATSNDAASQLPAIHLVFSLAKRRPLGTHHGAVGEKHMPAYLDEFVFRFNRRTARNLSHRFARVIEQAVQIGPTTYRGLVAKPQPA
jgi:hypothetical protein